MTPKRLWNILWTFGIFCFMVLLESIWYIFPVWVSRTKKNLANLVNVYRDVQATLTTTEAGFSQTYVIRSFYARVYTYICTSFKYRSMKLLYLHLWEGCQILNPGANPTTVSCSASVVKNYNATSICFILKRRPSLLKRWHCSCKFRSRRIGP
jgi:hypothetical protein